MTSTLPLSDLLVLDLTRAVAGPFCTMNLGDLGARVIKIEEPQSGDETRRWGPPFAGNTAAYFLSVNRNKESVAVDLKDPAGVDLVRRIARKADVVAENFRAGVAARLGIGYDELARDNPGLIYVSISGFGHDGPDRDRPGYDLIVQAMSGFMLVSAYPDGPPVKAGIPIADMFAAMYATQAILAALHRRAREGTGSYVEISLLECLLAAMAPVASSYLLTGREPQAMGPAQSNICPYQVFACQDGYVAAGAPNERLWRRFAEALDRPEWVDDPRYVNNGSRVAHRLELAAQIEDVLKRRNASDWVERLERFEVPCGGVLSIGQILNSPQIQARRAVVEMRHPALGAIRTMANPIRFQGTELRYEAPPELGDQTRAVVEEFLK